jgi:hypothetical protein
MAKRYSGDLTINVTYDDKKNDYRTSVYRGEEKLWNGRVRPAAVGFGPGIAYDSQKAYDQIASSALAFADDEVGGIGDTAAFDDKLTHFQISRAVGLGYEKVGHAVVGDRKSPAQLQRDIDAVVGKTKRRR